jgi:hypothetical protein
MPFSAQGGHALQARLGWSPQPNRATSPSPRIHRSPRRARGPGHTHENTANRQHPADRGVHKAFGLLCLGHSDLTHPIEAGYGPVFVQSLGSGANEMTHLPTTPSRKGSKWTLNTSHAEGRTQSSQDALGSQCLGHRQVGQGPLGHSKAAIDSMKSRNDGPHGPGVITEESWQ